MTLDVVDVRNEAVGAVALSDDVFGAPVNAGLIWTSVVHDNALDQRGTHATKTRGRVRGSGRKPWRQKGTGRARAGGARSPLWRGGGTVFGPQPRSHGYRVPRKVSRGALRSALTQKLRDGAITVVDPASVLAFEEPKTKLAIERLAGIGVSRSALIVDVDPDENLRLSMQNVPQIRVLAACRLTARDVLGCGRLVVSRPAVERLSEVLAP